MVIFTTLVNSEENITRLEKIYIKYRDLTCYIENDILKNS